MKHPVYKEYSRIHEQVPYEVDRIVFQGKLKGKFIYLCNLMVNTFDIYFKLRLFDVAEFIV